MRCCIHCDCIILLLTIIPAYRSGKYFLNYIVERAIIYGFLYALLYALLLTIIPAYRSGNFCFFLLLLHRLRVNISFEMVFIKLMLTWGYFYENKLHIYFNQLVLLQSIVLACYILIGITLRIHSCAKSVSTFSFPPIYLIKNKAYV